HGSYIGGSMGDPATAAEDPIYWSFHAFIDFTWARWQELHGTTPMSCGTCPLRGVETPTRSSDMENTETLGYKYKYEGPLAVPVVVADRPPPGGGAAPARETLTKTAPAQPPSVVAQTFAIRVPQLPITNADLELSQLAIPTDQ